MKSQRLNYETALQGLGAEGGTRTLFCFTTFFTDFAKSPTKSHFLFLRYMHRLHYPHSAVP